MKLISQVKKHIESFFVIINDTRKFVEKGIKGGY